MVIFIFTIKYYSIDLITLSILLLIFAIAFYSWRDDIHDIYRITVNFIRKFKLSFCLNSLDFAIKVLNNYFKEI